MHLDDVESKWYLVKEYLARRVSLAYHFTNSELALSLSFLLGSADSIVVITKEAQTSPLQRKRIDLMLMAPLTDGLTDD